MKLWLMIISCCLVFFTCNFSFTNSIILEEGMVVDKSQSTVNGDIYIGERCQVAGDCRSMNGMIKIGSRSQVRDIQSVNGEILIESFSKITGSIKSINGTIQCDKKVDILGSLATMNGTIHCQQVNVQGDIYTYHGDVLLSEKSQICGDIIIRKSSNENNSQPLSIIIKNETTVKGDIIVENPNLKTLVYLSEDSKVLGQIKNAEVKVYRG